MSRHYLEKAKELCAARGIRFHVLPCPLDRTTVFEDAEKVYEQEPLPVDPSLLQDPVHFQDKYVPMMRQRVIEYYGLPKDLFRVK